MDKSDAQIAEQVFFNVFHGSKNFMTPKIIRYGLSGGYAYELSTGTDMTNEPIYGVTCCNAMLGTREIDKDKMFYTLEEAEAHIRRL